MVGYPRVPAGRLVVERSRRRSRGPARHQIPRRRPGHVAAAKSARALDGFGCPTEAPYGCFLPDLTRFGTCRHPNPSNALGARYILPAPAQQGKVANLGRVSIVLPTACFAPLRHDASGRPAPRFPSADPAARPMARAPPRGRGRGARTQAEGQARGRQVKLKGLTQEEFRSQSFAAQSLFKPSKFWGAVQKSRKGSPVAIGDPTLFTSY